MKKILSLFVSVVLICSACVNINATDTGVTGQMIVDDLNENYVGKFPYILNTRGPESFDCSGLVHYIYSLYGVTLPTTTRDDYRPFGRVIEDVEQLRSGDILLFGTEEELNHVGIYDENEGYIIHALNSRVGIVRQPQLSVWISDSSWNSQGSNQFQYAVRVFDVEEYDITAQEEEVDAESMELCISDTSRVLGMSETENGYDSAVEEMQKCLNAVLDINIGTDGVFGEETREAVICFQTEYGLDADGIAGPQTLEKLNELVIEKIITDDNSDGVEKTVVQLKIDSPDMYVNGKRCQVDPGRNTAPIIRNSRTLVPVRAVVENYGAEVLWDNEEKIVTILSDETVMKFRIDSFDAEVDGEIHIMEVAPVVIDGRTFMPLRFVAEKMGLDVMWNNEDGEITVEGFRK